VSYFFGGSESFKLDHKPNLLDLQIGAIVACTGKKPRPRKSTPPGPRGASHPQLVFSLTGANSV
jgi:hypothetical protein